MPKTNAPHPPSYGDLWSEQGGFVVDYVPSIARKPGWFLIASPAEAGEAADLAWGPYRKQIAGADDPWDGYANTRALLASGHTCPAAEFCAGLRIGGFDDWYLPATREQRLLYARVPELFQRRIYWSSTQISAGWAWYQNFAYGSQYASGKGNKFLVRAVRRFLVP